MLRKGFAAEGIVAGTAVLAGAEIEVQAHDRHTLGFERRQSLQLIAQRCVE